MSFGTWEAKNCEVMSHVVSRAKNWLIYACRSQAEKLVLGAKVRDTPSFSYNDTPTHIWRPEKGPTGVIECEHLPGLLLIREFVSQEQLAAIERTVEQCTSASPEAPRHSTCFRYHEFDPARLVAPMLPKAIPADVDQLANFEAPPSPSENCVSPLSLIHI